VISLPSVGQLITSAGVSISNTSLPLLVPDCLASYIPPPSAIGVNVTSFTVRVADAFVSTDSRFVITIINRYFPPDPQPQQKTINENQNLRVGFPEALSTIEQFRVQTSNHVVSDRPFVQVKTWPRYGRLFQVGADGKPSIEIIPNGSSSCLYDEPPHISHL
jgi:hypothetical protein